MSERAWPNEYRTTLICVDSYQDGVLKGSFYNPFLPEGVAFHSATDFLLKMEGALDQMAFPQSFCAARSFAPPPSVPQAPAGCDQRAGKLATFALRVIFRQNASWQGSVSWLEGKADQSFRSVLELLLMMDGALRS